jgi:hypothetical protein
MWIPTSKLDSTSFDYLRQVEQTKGGAVNGLFAPRVPTWRDLRRGWFKFIFFGLVFLGFLIIPSWPSIIASSSPLAIRIWQTILATLATLFLAIGLRRKMQKAGQPPIGDFLYVDALHVWEVSPANVQATCIEDLIDVDGTHHLYGGNYLYTNFALTLPGDRHEFRVNSRLTAERVMKYINLLKSLRNTDNEDLRVLLRTSPEMAGALAYRLTFDQPVGDLASISPGPTLPRPREDGSSNAAAPAAGSGGRKWVPWLAAAAVGGIGYFLFPLIDNFLVDDYLYAKTTHAAPQDTAPLEAYLKKVPNGSHAKEVREALDDQRFALAVRPALLRTYLDDPANVRHRDEAEQKIRDFYDRTIDDLTRRRDMRGEKATAIDEKMFTAVIDLLKDLKKSGNPVVLVGFKGKQDADPQTAEQKLVETIAHAQHVAGNAELDRIAKAAADKTAILSRGPTFDPVQTKAREGVILRHLSQSVEKVIGSDVLQLKPAAAGDKPVMEVAYHILPSGTLYTYTSTETVTPPFGGLPRTTTTTKGLLRGYKVDWDITFHTSGKPPYDCPFPSEPLNSLKYSSEASDPDWVPYLIILHSAFDDMSRRMIKNFGLDPPPARDSYSYADVRGDGVKP